MEAKQERKEQQSMLAEQQSSFHDEERNVDENLEELDAIERRHVDMGDAAGAEDVLSEPEEHGDEGDARQCHCVFRRKMGRARVHHDQHQRGDHHCAHDACREGEAGKGPGADPRPDLLVARLAPHGRICRLHLTPSLVRFTKLYLTPVKKAATLREPETRPPLGARVYLRTLRRSWVINTTPTKLNANPPKILEGLALSFKLEHFLKLGPHGSIRSTHFCGPSLRRHFVIFWRMKKL